MRKKSLGCGIGFWSVWRLDDNIEGTCIPGCTDDNACNYDPNALFNDGSCEACVCPGDLDGDQAIGVADVLALLSEFGCASSCSADLDGDDQVGVSDILLILSVFGQSCQARLSPMQNAIRASLIG